MSKEAMKLALEAITTYLSESPDPSEEAVEGLCDAASMLKKALAEQPAQQEPVCGWKREDDDHMPDTWRSDCGVLWTFTDGGPTENDMKYCCGCGAKLRSKNEDRN